MVNSFIDTSLDARQYEFFDRYVIPTYDIMSLLCAQGVLHSLLELSNEIA